MTGCTSPSRLTKPPGMTRERMGKNIAGAQQRNHALEDGIDILAVGAAGRQSPELTEMNIDRQVGAAPDLGRHFDDANAPAGEAADFGMGLDAANEVAVGGGRLHRGVDFDAVGAIEVGVIMSFQASDQIGGQKGQRARLGLLDNEVPETGQRHAGRAALIDQRGDPGLDTPPYRHSRRSGR